MTATVDKVQLKQSIDREGEGDGVTVTELISRSLNLAEGDSSKVVMGDGTLGDIATSTPTLVTSGGSGQDTATQLSVGRSVINGGAFVALPDAVAGAWCILTVVSNTGSADFYAKNGTDDTINGGAGNVAYFIGSYYVIYCDCFETGAWLTNAQVD